MKNASVAHWWEHSTLQSSKHVKAVFQLLLKNKSRGRGHINTRCRRRNCEHVGVRADGAEDIIKAIGVHILLFSRRVLEYEELNTLPCFTVCICGSVKAICSLSALSGSTRINLEMCVWPWTSQQTRQQQLSPLDPARATSDIYRFALSSLEMWPRCSSRYTSHMDRYNFSPCRRPCVCHQTSAASQRRCLQTPFLFSIHYSGSLLQLPPSLKTAMQARRWSNQTLLWNGSALLSLDGWPQGQSTDTVITYLGEGSVFSPKVLEWTAC